MVPGRYVPPVFRMPVTIHISREISGNNWQQLTIVTQPQGLLFCFGPVCRHDLPTRSLPFAGWASGELLVLYISWLISLQAALMT